MRHAGHRYAARPLYVWPTLLGIEMLDHKWTQILIYEFHPDLQIWCVALSKFHCLCYWDVLGVRPPVPRKVNSFPQTLVRI
jgi:hypothetical protein